MNNVSLRTTLTSVLVTCLLLPAVGHPGTRQVATTLGDVDRGKAITVGTTDNHFYRFLSHQWSINTEGAVQGTAFEYPSLEAAEQGIGGTGIHPVTIPPERIAFLDATDNELTGGGTVAVIVHTLMATYVLIGAIAWLEKALRRGNLRHWPSGKLLGNQGGTT